MHPVNDEHDSRGEGVEDQTLGKSRIAELAFPPTSSPQPLTPVFQGRTPSTALTVRSSFSRR